MVPGTGLSVEDFVAKVLLEYTTGKIKHHKVTRIADDRVGYGDEERHHRRAA